MITTLSKTPTCVKRTDLPLIFRNWRPAHHEILMVELTPTNERIVPITNHLDALFINALTGEELYRYSLDIGSETLYAIASRLHVGKYYVVRASDYACSCWSYRTSSACNCAEEVRQYVESQEVCYA